MSAQLISDLNLQDPILPQLGSHRTANTVGLKKTTEKKEMFKRRLVGETEDRNSSRKTEERKDKTDQRSEKF